MNKILFGITSLTLGGAERVLVDVANALCDKYEITIFTIYANGELENQLNKKIKLKSLYKVRFDELSNLQQKVIMPLKILVFKNYIYNKRIKDNYNVEVAFLEGPITRLISVKNKNTKKIAWIHNDISKVFGQDIKSKIKKIIDKNIYSKYQELVFVSKDNLEKFNEAYTDKKMQQNNKRVIYNYIDSINVIEKSEKFKVTEFDNQRTNFVTVARLVPQKAIDRLIRIHSKLIKNGLTHNFYIIGDGPEKEKLESMIKQFNVQNSFFLLGKKENPYPYIKEADYFTLLTYFEGYPMTVEEAKILNKKIIITNTAAREVVENYENKTIIENNEEAIYEGLKKIIQNNTKEDVKEKANYSNKNRINEIIKLLGE